MAAPPDTSRFERFPGWEIVAAGLADIAAGRTTPSACAVWIAYPRLRRAGLVDGRYDTRRLDAAELELYRLLRSEGGDAYSRYNAFLRRLIRFEHALDRDSVRS